MALDGMDFSLVAVLANFTRSGNLNLTSNSVRSVGLDVDLWSKNTQLNPDDAYYLAFDSGNIYQSNYSLRWLGFAVRCLSN